VHEKLHKKLRQGPRDEQFGCQNNKDNRTKWLHNISKEL